MSSFNASWLQKSNVDWFSLRGHEIAESPFLNLSADNLNILLKVHDFFYPTDERCIEISLDWGAEPPFECGWKQIDKSVTAV